MTAVSTLLAFQSSIFNTLFYKLYQPAAVSSTTRQRVTHSILVVVFLPYHPCPDTVQQRVTILQQSKLSSKVVCRKANILTQTFDTFSSKGINTSYSSRHLFHAGYSSPAIEVLTRFSIRLYHRPRANIFVTSATLPSSPTKTPLASLQHCSFVCITEVDLFRFITIQFSKRITPELNGEST